MRGVLCKGGPRVKATNAANLHRFHRPDRDRSVCLACALTDTGNGRSRWPVMECVKNLRSQGFSTFEFRDELSGMVSAAFSEQGSRIVGAAENRTFFGTAWRILFLMA